MAQSKDTGELWNVIWEFNDGTQDQEDYDLFSEALTAIHKKATELKGKLRWIQLEDMKRG